MMMVWSMLSFQYMRLLCFTFNFHHACQHGPLSTKIPLIFIFTALATGALCAAREIFLRFGAGLFFDLFGIGRLSTPSIGRHGVSIQRLRGARSVAKRGLPSLAPASEWTHVRDLSKKARGWIRGPLVRWSLKYILATFLVKKDELKQYMYFLPYLFSLLLLSLTISHSSTQ